MIYIDSAVGSNHLIKYLPQTELVNNLANIDVCWEGNCEHGLAAIGAEIKTIEEMIGSVNGNKRFVAQQIPKYLKNFNTVYLIVQGIFRESEGGLIEILRSGFQVPKSSCSWMSYHKHISSIELQYNIKVKHTSSVKETAKLIWALYQWWDKSWDSHMSHKGIYTPPMQSSFVAPSFVKKVINLLPGVSMKKIEVVCKHFRHSFQGLAKSTKEQWMEIPGIGETTADKIMKELSR